MHSIGRFALALGMSTAVVFGGTPTPTLIITGQQNHNWWYTSRIHKDTLDATGLFVCDIAENPADVLADASKLAKYKLFVLDYNGPRWGDSAEKNFIKAVNDGAGVVCIHAANNSFTGWADYERMVGLNWVTDITGHGEFHAFDVENVAPTNPITKGLAAMKQHPDELYHKLQNPQKAEFTLLARAMSDKAKGGTGDFEPMALTLAFGKGRVFHTPLGHVWVDAENTKGSVVDPQFRILLSRGAEWAATGAVTQGANWADVRPANVLAATDAASGWTLLFDGTTTANWRGFKQDAFPSKGWEVSNGMLHLKPGENGGDITSAAEYADFEFELDFKVAKGGNSGIIYRATEDHTYPWETGPEYQILDDANHADGKKDKTRSGTLYDIIPRAHDVSRPAGEWNTARIVARGTHIEHWLNGVKVVDIDTTSPEYVAAHKASKWPQMPDYGKRSKGRICLQDHGDEVWLRNIRVRELSSK